MAQVPAFDQRLPLPAAFRVPEKPAAGAGQRGNGSYPEVDWIKAVGIVTVVLIHSLPTSLFGEDISKADEMIGRLTRFAVPGFLACSGYLFAASKSSRALGAVRQRLQRLLLPYLAFSVAAWCVEKARTLTTGEPGEPRDPNSFLLRLLLCAELGPYYYVFLIVALVLLTPLVARLPRRLVPLVAAAAVTLQFAHDMFLLPPLPWFWEMRSPARSLGPFLVGWCAYLHREGLCQHLEQGRRRLCWLALLASLFAAGAAGLASLPALSYPLLALEVAQCYVVLGLLLVGAVGQAPAPALARWLSNASYPIYLGHLFFVAPALIVYPHIPGAFEPARILVVWAAGLGNTAGMVLLGRDILGAKLARKVLG